VRELQRELEARGAAIGTRVDESGSRPGYLMVVDPDGNPILVDRHA
jgi:hypothetical protein